MSGYRTVLFLVLIGLLLTFGTAEAQEIAPCNFTSPIAGGYPNGNWGFQTPTPWESTHTGVDYVYPGGTPVLAVEEGIVEWTGWWPSEGESRRTGFGPSVWVRDECGIYSFYAHLSPIIPVHVGQRIVQGQVIGFIGDIPPAGNVKHLHFGKWLPRNGGDPSLGYRWQGQWFDPLVNMGFSIQPRPLVKSHWSQEAWIALGLILGIAGVLLFFVMLFTGKAEKIAHRALFRIFWGPSQRTVRIWRGAFWLAISITLPCSLVMSMSQLIGLRIQASRGLSPIFTPEVQKWKGEIIVWSNYYDLDPNLAATVMQIESCGREDVVSEAGAEGQYQVMPFHFKLGENHRDRQINSRRGLAYLKTGLELADGDVGLALAGYNGGHSMISRDSSLWPAETQRYYYWATGIYNDANSGKTKSSRLEEWLNIDGGRLCPSTLEK